VEEEGLRKEKKRKYYREWAKNNRDKCNKYQRKWRERNPGKSAEYNRRWREKNPGSAKDKKQRQLSIDRAYRGAMKRWSLKMETIRAYGGECECCGDTQPEFLTLDHINGGGRAHREEVGRGSKDLYLWLKRNNYPDIIRVLCYNCNCSLGHRGYCPHEARRTIGTSS